MIVYLLTIKTINSENKTISNNILKNSSYARLPSHFYETINPSLVPKPELVLFNQKLARELKLNFQNNQETADFLSGNSLMLASKPISLAYAGHQYGHFVPQLGDGRAVLLGEVQDTTGKSYEMQLKGSGRTRFSRGGDGKAVLGPMIREYIVSEFMYAAGIPTTRALSVVRTGEDVIRDKILPGAILTRIAKCHIRVGTFEYFAAKGDIKSVKILADYIIEKYHINLKNQNNHYKLLLTNIIDSQAFLIAKWMQIGFIHGVMNTDNVSIIGETIDYGPCAFMDFYDPRVVYSSIDKYGRYAYNNQARIGEWNISMLVQCFLPLLAQDVKKATVIAEELIASFMPKYQNYLQIGMCAKIGIKYSQESDFKLVQELLDLMAEFKVDFTLCFRYLGNMLKGNKDEYPRLLKGFFNNSKKFDYWLSIWQIRLIQEKISLNEIAENMDKVNPAVIPRNHLIEAAIRKAEEENDISDAKNLISVCTQPFADQWEDSKYVLPPEPGEIVRKTYCGT